LDTIYNRVSTADKKPTGKGDKYMSSIPDREDIIKTLESLVQIAAVTGFEDDLRESIKKKVAPYADTREDQMGNFTAVRRGTGDGLKIMLCAHMDEIGFVVRSIDPRGFLYLYPLGGLPANIGPGHWVNVHTDRGPIPGTIGIHAPHLPVSGNPPLFVDIGAERRHQAMAMGIKIGDPVTVQYGFSQLNGERLIGRCMDNRIGCTVLVTVLKMLSQTHHKSSIFAVFSSTEEHGMHPGNPPAQMHGARGAYLAAQNIKPHFTIVLDSIAASDIPGLPESEKLIRLGQGVALRLVDDMAIMRPRVKRFARAVAERNNIRIQEGISRSYTDASMVQLLDTAVCTLGIPLRYNHSPGQVVSISDIESAIKMVTGIINMLDTQPPHWLQIHNTGN
jgi:endoglucanase